MTYLDNLITAVEAGDDAFISEHEHANIRIGDINAGTVRAAYWGGLDAAIYFFDSAITKGGWVVSQHIAKVVTGEIESQQVFRSVIPRNPARALLLSTLKALRSEQ